MDKLFSVGPSWETMESGTSGNWLVGPYITSSLSQCLYLDTCSLGIDLTTGPRQTDCLPRLHADTAAWRVTTGRRPLLRITEARRKQSRPIWKS